MSLSPNSPNILSDAMYKAGELYGAPGYPVGLVDIRLWAALFQFGWVGLGIVLWLTGMVWLKFIKASMVRAYQHRDEIGAMAGVVVGFMASSLPINLFTVDNTVSLGGLLIFLAYRASREVEALKSERGHNEVPPANAVPG